MSDFNDDFDPEELADAMEVERKGRREDRQLERDIALLSRLALTRDQCCVCELGDPKPGGYLCRQCAKDHHG